MLETITNMYEMRPKELTRFVKFAIVGAFGAVIDFGLLNLLRGFFGWPLLWANTVSVSVAIVSNFIWNRLWTFPESRERPLHTQFGQFASVNVVGLGINEIVFLGTDALWFGTMFVHPLDYNVAKAAAIIMTARNIPPRNTPNDPCGSTGRDSLQRMSFFPDPDLYIHIPVAGIWVDKVRLA